MNTYAAAFDGAWPYLTELAATAGPSDPLDPDVVRSYWGGQGRCWIASTGTASSTSCGAPLPASPPGCSPGFRRRCPGAPSFHVFVVMYPWVRFLSAEMPPTRRRCVFCGTAESAGAWWNPSTTVPW